MLDILRSSHRFDLIPTRELLCRRVDLQPTEILVKVFLPYTQRLEYVREFKQAHRRDDDIAIANGGMRVRFRHTADGEPLCCMLLAPLDITRRRYCTASHLVS